MDAWKVYIEKLKKRPYSALGLLLLLALPLALAMVFRVQDVRTKATLPNALEAEQGILTTGASKQSDSGASGGQYVRFDQGQVVTPTPSQDSWGPRPSPSTPTGSNVYTVPNSIDGTGNTNVSTALQNFVNSIPDGTSSNPSIIVFPAGKTYQLINSIYLTDLNKITLWGYENTIRLTGNGNSSKSSAFRVERSDDIKIFGFRIIGNDPDVTSLNGGQFQQGVAIFNDSDNTEVADMHISDVWGDGIYTFTFSQPAGNNWNFHHNLIENAGRQGITINQGDGKIEYNIIRSSGMASIDAEDQSSAYPSNGGNKNLGPVLIANNWIDGWEQVNDFVPHSITIGYSTEDMEAVHDITIENNLFTGGDLGIHSPYLNDSSGVISFWGNILKTNLIIRNNKFELPNDQRSGWAMRIKNLNDGSITNNSIPGMTVECQSCSNVNISGNN